MNEDEHLVLTVSGETGRLGATGAVGTGLASINGCTSSTVEMKPTGRDGLTVCINTRSITRSRIIQLIRLF